LNKRTFLRKGGGLLVGGALSSFYGSSACTRQEDGANTIPAVQNTRTNWAGNLTYQASEYHQPTSVEQLQETIRNAPKIRALGTRHCFNEIADSAYGRVSVGALDNSLQVNADKMQATIGAGASYGQICRDLYQQGYALHNLASLPHISVAGAMATATHGSGMANRNLGSAVAGFEFIDADGSMHQLSREQHGDQVEGLLTHLGLLGVLTRITLDLEPAFEVSQRVYQNLPVKRLLEEFKPVMKGGYSVSLFTDYLSDRVNQVWVKSKVTGDQQVDPEDYFGATPATRDLHPITELSAVNCTEQMGVPGPWFDRLPHFKMDFTPSSGKELQSEFFVPIEYGAEAFEVITRLKHQLEPVLMISEIRSIAADSQWMSPFYQQDSVAFHFTWEQDKQGVAAVLPLIQDGLEQFGVRPHWGKVFSISPGQLRSSYPHLDKFKQAVEVYDPERKFVNQFLQQLFYS